MKILRLRALSLLACCLTLPLQAQTIITTALDLGSGSGDTGEFTTQAIVNGNPAVAYYNVTEKNLMFARNSAPDGTGSWTIITLDINDDVGFDASLAVVNGNPAVSYLDSTKGTLKYVRANDANGTNWGTPITVDTTSGTVRSSSLAVINGRPAIGYRGNNHLFYIRANDASGTSWGVPVTADGNGTVGASPSLVVVNGNPAMSYVDQANSDVKYVRAVDVNGASWGTPMAVDSVGDTSSMTIVNGNPAICYGDYGNSRLKYIRAADPNGTSWGTPVIVDSAIKSSGISLNIVNSNPAIAYFETNNLDLKYVRASDASGTSWGTPLTLDSDGNVGSNPSLLVVSGQPAITYYGVIQPLGNGDLKYIRASDASGASWPAPTVADSGAQAGNVGTYSSQAIVNGNPAISYYDATKGDLRYIRATDPAGTNWGVPVVVDSTGDVGSYSSLTIVNGNPAIAYYSGSSPSLKYVRATDASGTAWGAPVKVYVTGDVGLYASLAVVNGNPAVSFRGGATTGNLSYVRATNATGTTWGAPVAVDSVGNVGQYTSLTVVNGNPAISYYDSTNQDLKYVRASDVSGTNWGTPVAVDSTGSVGSYTSLVVVNGSPAISYYDSTNQDLKYVRAGDSNGTSWGMPIAVDSTGSQGQHTSLAVVNGKPAISYYGNVVNFSGNLKYVRAKDPNGAGWGTPVTVDSAGDVGRYSSLVVVNGNPAISYQDSTEANLKWAALLFPPPDIAVEQPAGTNLTDGTSNVAFGTVNVGGSAVKTFTIKNPGNSDLSNLQVGTDGTNAGDFTVGALGSTLVAPGGSTTFTVTFMPGAGGARSAAIHISSNVPGAKNPFDITLTGVGNAAPVLSLPASPVVAEATGPNGANVSFVVSADDAEDGPLTPMANPPGGSVFPLGDTTVQVSVTDSNGAVGTGSFVVRVQDTTPPMVTVPASPVVAEATSSNGAAVTFAVSASDIVDGAVPALPDHASGSLFPLGDTLVHVTAMDAHGNPASASFTVSVVDTTGPTITHLPDPLTITADATNHAPAPDLTGQVTATDNVGVTGITQDPAPGTILPFGPHTVTFTVVDAAHNASTGSTILTVADGPALTGRYAGLLSLGQPNNGDQQLAQPRVNGRPEGPAPVRALMELKLTSGRFLTGFLRLPDARRVWFPGTVLPADTHAETLLLNDGSSLALEFDGSGHVAATLTGRDGLLSGEGVLADAGAPVGVPGAYTAILEADGATAPGWLYCVVSKRGAMRLSGKLPDGSTINSGQGSIVDRHGDALIFMLGKRPTHPLLTGRVHFENLAASDFSGTLAFNDGPCAANGAHFLPASSGLPAGAYPLTLSGAGIDITSTVSLLSNNTASVLAPVTKFQPRSGPDHSSSGVFYTTFSASNPPTRPLIRGSGVFYQKLGIGAGQFPRNGGVGRIQLGAVSEQPPTQTLSPSAASQPSAGFTRAIQGNSSR